MLRTIKKFIAKYWVGRSDYCDYSLMAVVVLLIAFGLVMLYSTSSYSAEATYGDDMYYFKRQLIFAAVSLAFMWFLSHLKYRIWKFWAIPIYIAALGTMILVRYAGHTSHGSSRWLYMGSIGFQPAELAKIAVILTLPLFIVGMGRKLKTAWGTTFSMFLGLLLSGVAMVFTDNLSTAIIIGLITLLILFIAHPSIKGFVIVFIGLGALVVLAVFLVKNGFLTDSFRYSRVLVWLDPEKYSDSGGYQVMQGLYAIGSGGLFGKGLGNSTQKLGSLPEAQNDMIFSIICEELGIFGGILLLILFVYLLYRLLFIAQNASDLFGSLVVSGIFVHIALQVILNICVVTNVIPTTGVTLPFVSYGGTSLFLILVEMGIALGISRGIRFEGKEKLTYDRRRR